MSIRMNKGEHSESLLALYLLLEGHVLQCSEYYLSYNASTTKISLRNMENTLVDDLVLNIEELIPNIVCDIQHGRGSFVLNILNPYYNLLTSNGIKVKSPSSYKSDLILSNYKDVKGVTVLKAGVSIKSFLGSNPSLLNASKHYTGFEYILGRVGEVDLRQGMFWKDIPQNILDAIVFDKYSNPVFQSLVGEFDILPQLVVSWKSGNGSKIVDLLDHMDDMNTKLKKTYAKQVDDFVGRVIQGSNEDDCPTLLGTVHKDGSMGLSSLNSLGKMVYFDAPSRSRHNYGYVYQEDGFWRIRIVIGIRSMSSISS